MAHCVSFQWHPCGASCSLHVKFFCKIFAEQWWTVCCNRFVGWCLPSFIEKMYCKCQQVLLKRLHKTAERFPMSCLYKSSLPTTNFSLPLIVDDRHVSVSLQHCVKVMTEASHSTVDALSVQAFSLVFIILLRAQGEVTCTVPVLNSQVWRSCCIQRLQF